jgi:Mg2+ and Co2+ transporter CorA
MTSITPAQEAAVKYRERIKRLGNCNIAPWPGFTSLRIFTELTHLCKDPPKISRVNIPREGGHASEFSITALKGPHDLLGQLPSLADTSPFSELIIIENICPDTLTLLGGAYDIDPQFFAEHVSVLSWYQMFEKVPERLPSLPSTKKAEDFLTLRYVSTRELDEKDDASISAESVIWPDMDKTRLRHSAGRLKPVSGPEKTFPPMAFTRQVVSVWCQKKTNCDGWIAIMLLDRPFQLYQKYGSLGQPEYRNPNLRPKANEEFHGDETRQTFREAFCSFLEQRCSADEMYLRTCATDTFLIFYEGYRIIASEWLVVNEYVKRELANIERHLEKKESTFQELEQHLKELYRIRRRCNKDRELVIEAASQCEKRGQALWPTSKGIPHGNADAITFAERHAQELEDDFKYVLSNMSISISRIEKDINLLMALVAISEGRQGLQENRGISFLTLVATIFLPSETVATVLGIQTQYGPGAHNFWMLWAVALPLTILVITIPFSYPTASARLNHLWAKYFRAKPKTVCKSLSGSQDEGMELSQDLMLLMHQTSIGSVV